MGLIINILEQILSPKVNNKKSKINEKPKKTEEVKVNVTKEPLKEKLVLPIPKVIQGVIDGDFKVIFADSPIAVSKSVTIKEYVFHNEYGLQYFSLYADIHGYYRYTEQIDTKVFVPSCALNNWSVKDVEEYLSYRYEEFSGILYAEEVPKIPELEALYNGSMKFSELLCEGKEKKFTIAENEKGERLELVFEGTDSSAYKHIYSAKMKVYRAESTEIISLAEHRTKYTSEQFMDFIKEEYPEFKDVIIPDLAYMPIVVSWFDEHWYADIASCDEEREHGVIKLSFNYHPSRRYFLQAILSTEIKMAGGKKKGANLPLKFMIPSEWFSLYTAKEFLDKIKPIFPDVIIESNNIDKRIEALFKKEPSDIKIIREDSSSELILSWGEPLNKVIFNRDGISRRVAIEFSEDGNEPISMALKGNRDYMKLFFPKINGLVKNEKVTDMILEKAAVYLYGNKILDGCFIVCNNSSLNLMLRGDEWFIACENDEIEPVKIIRDDFGSAESLAKFIAAKISSEDDYKKFIHVYNLTKIN